MPESRPSDSRQVDHGPLSPAGVKALKVAVIVMAVMIVVGVAVVIGRIFYLAANQPTAAANVQTQAAPKSVAFKPRMSLALPARAKVERMALDGGRLAIHYAAGGDAKASAIVVLDLTTGRTLSKIDLLQSK